MDRRLPEEPERCWLLANLGREEEAIQRIRMPDHVVRLRPDQLLLNARVLLRAGRESWAEELLQIATDRVPASVEAWMMLALVRQRLGREVEAAEAASWAVMLERHASDKSHLDNLD